MGQENDYELADAMEHLKLIIAAWKETKRQAVTDQGRAVVQSLMDKYEQDLVALQQQLVESERAE